MNPYIIKHITLCQYFSYLNHGFAQLALTLANHENNLLSRQMVNFCKDNINFINKLFYLFVEQMAICTVKIFYNGISRIFFNTYFFSKITSWVECTAFNVVYNSRRLPHYSF